ncbi:MAG: plasmid stabilization protein [Deltaproteobacteria bacterium CG23_combo_of_CG06-09_8_20_14_all_51_20]|nr:MAG: plasmid stabilization protein [Deltaproteobacteria bacterium CG23_combo_of_CG06-09_8_20_14_all_51_20]
MKVRFLLAAEIEMFDAAAFYEKQVALLGKNFLSIMEAAIDEISAQPETWPVIGDGVRKRPLRRFPYLILYRIEEEEIVIVAVMHQRRRPYYWGARL